MSFTDVKLRTFRSEFRFWGLGVESMPEVRNDLLLLPEQLNSEEAVNAFFDDFGRRGFGWGEPEHRLQLA